MRRARITIASAVLVAAFGFGGTAFAGGTPDPLAALAGSRLSTGQLGATRGGSDVNLNNAFNTTTNDLNVTSSSSGRLNGSVSGESSTGSVVGSTIQANTGFTNVFSNTGNNVMMNSSVSIFISAQ